MTLKIFRLLFYMDVFGVTSLYTSAQLTCGDLSISLAVENLGMLEKH